MKDTYLITGAAGFVASHITEVLHSKGIKVRGLVRSIAKAKSQNVPLPEDLVEGDITNKASLEKAMQEVVGVYHIAALFREAKSKPSEYFKVNAEGTKNVFEVAKSLNIPRVIHCSTTGVLGSIKNPPANEDSEYAPCDIYQESKVEAEKIALSFYNEGSVRGVIIRPGMIYGPRDTRLLKIFKMIAKARFFYVGPGNAWCHFIDVRDLANAFYLAMEHTELNGKIYTIAGDGQLRLNEFCDKIADILQVQKPWLHIPVVPMQLLGDLCEIICKPFGIEPPLYRRRVDFYIKHRSFDISRAKNDLGFMPERDFDSELRDIISWYQLQNML